MSSWWIGLYGHGSQRVVIGVPRPRSRRGAWSADRRSARTTRSCARSPPAARRRARSNGRRPPARSSTSSTSANAPRSPRRADRSRGTGASDLPGGRYTECVDITSAAFAFRQCASSSPVPSALHADRVVEVEPGPHERGEVQHVGEVVGQTRRSRRRRRRTRAWSRRWRRPARASRDHRSARSPTLRCRPRGTRRAGTRSDPPDR